MKKTFCFEKGTFILQKRVEKAFQKQFRSSHSQMFFKRDFTEKFPKIHRKTPVSESGKLQEHFRWLLLDCC